MPSILNAAQSPKTNSTRKIILNCISKFIAFNPKTWQRISGGGSKPRTGKQAGKNTPTTEAQRGFGVFEVFGLEKSQESWQKCQIGRQNSYKIWMAAREGAGDGEWMIEWATEWMNAWLSECLPILLSSNEPPPMQMLSSRLPMQLANKEAKRAAVNSKWSAQTVKIEKMFQAWKGEGLSPARSRILRHSGDATKIKD